MLTERDAKNVFKELLEATNKAYLLGLAFELPPHEVDAIKKTYPDPQECLLQVILAFLTSGAQTDLEGHCGCSQESSSQSHCLG